MHIGYHTVTTLLHAFEKSQIYRNTEFDSQYTQIYRDVLNTLSPCQTDAHNTLTTT